MNSTVSDTAWRETQSRATRVARRSKRKGTGSHWAPYLFITPFFLLFLPFGAGSVALAFGMAFTEWPLGGSPSFVGVENLSAVLQDPLFGRAMSNTTLMLVGFMLALMPLGLFIAVVLKQLRMRSANIIQLIVFAPVTMSLIAVALVFDLMYNDRVGFVNGVVGMLGFETVGFLTDASIAPWAIIAMRLWRVVGYYAVILFAGLQSIPEELYEAAAIDGAGPLRRFWSITLPMLKPVTLFVIVASSIAAWELFAEPSVLTEGGPARSTYTAVMYIFDVSFSQFSLGEGAAASAVLAVAIIASTLIATRLLRGDDRER